LGEILIEKGLITPEQLKSALGEQQRTKEFLGAILVRRKQIKERDLLEALSEQFNMAFIGLKDKYIDWSMVKQFSPALILDHKCFPIQKDKWSITMAITNPFLDTQTLKRAEEEARGLGVRYVLVTQADMQEIIQRYKQYLRGNISRLFE